MATQASINKKKKTNSQTVQSPVDKKAGMKRRQKRNYNSYSRFIYKVLKRVHPEIGISSRAMDVLNHFILDMLSRIAVDSSHLAQISKRRTLGFREVETATKLLLPGELGKYAVHEAVEAFHKYHEFK